MCRAFSCLIDRNKAVTWKFGVDSHEDLITIAGYKDDKDDPAFARCEIVPANKNYLNPDKWVFKLDEGRAPSWWSVSYEDRCFDAHEKWLGQLNKILVRKRIIHPFRIDPPETITEEHIASLKEWASVRASVGASVRASVWASVRVSVRASVRASVGASVRDSVWASVGASVWDSVRDSVRASVRDSVWASVRDSVRASVRASVWDSVGDSVWDSVWAYTGSFFVLDRNAWKYTESIKTDEYPFLPLVKLWEQGLVPSFDGTTWRLHGGKDAKVLWEGEFK